MRTLRESSRRSHKTPIRGITDRALIRELFVQRKPQYGLADVMRLTRTNADEIAAALRLRDIEAVPHAGAELQLDWATVAALAFERWTSRMIAAALDVFHRDAIPSLNRVTYIEVQLPLYQIRLLHVLAETQGAGFRARLNASDILERQLLDLASSLDLSVMEDAIPGFAAALRYPYFIPRDDDWATAFCRFCGRLSGVAGREMCDDCISRHEPKMHLGEHGLPELDREE